MKATTPDNNGRPSRRFPMGAPGSRHSDPLPRGHNKLSKSDEAGVCRVRSAPRPLRSRAAPFCSNTAGPLVSTNLADFADSADVFLLDPEIGPFSAAEIRKFRKIREFRIKQESSEEVRSLP
ncbi:MAG: hypothetical protein ACE5HB_05590 [Terriglobia bacterium]